MRYPSNFNGAPEVMEAVFFRAPITTIIHLGKTIGILDETRYSMVVAYPGGRHRFVKKLKDRRGKYFFMKGRKVRI